MSFKPKFLLVLFFFAFSGRQTTAQWQSAIVKLENDRLVYQSDGEGNRIPDFSYAGYKHSNSEVPRVTKILRHISPVQGDNTAHINKAIRSLASAPADKNGIRGVLVLRKGGYDVSGIIRLDVDGLILRGEGSGDDPAKATVIYGRGNVPANRSVLVAGSGKRNWHAAGEKASIVTDFIPVNSLSFEVDNTTGFKAGDEIIIEHPCTEEWLRAVDYGGTADAASERWKVGEHPIVFKRKIEDIRGRTIVLDVPLYNHLDRKLAPSFIRKVESSAKSHIGVENLRIEILDWTGRDSDETHAATALELVGVEDSWVRNVSTANFINSGIALSNADRVSVLNCRAEDPVSLIKGGRRYNFAVNDHCAQILFKDCIATKGRHNYISNGTTTVSGVVFLNCRSVDPYASSEGHRRWSMALLFDNLKDYGNLPRNKIVLGVYNRGSYGTGHGWSLAHSVVWNADLRRISGQLGILICQKPPTAQNYVLGGFGTVNRNMPFPQYPKGYVEGVNNPGTLMPRSLFEQQLKDRLLQRK